MSGRINLLSVVLAVQLVIIAIVVTMDTGFGEVQPGPLLEFSADAVDEVRIDDGENDRSVTLVRDGDAWRLADGLPADHGRLENLLDKLAGLQAGWPVATSAAAGSRFEVTEDAHQRRLVLGADGTTVAELFLGTSPGFQRVHARRGDDSATFSIALANHEVPASADEWLDKTLLQPRGNITEAVRHEAWTLTRGADGWLVDDAPADQEAAARLIRRLAELRVAGTAQAPAPGAEALAVIGVTDAEGSYELHLYDGGSDSPHTLRSDRRDGYFRLARYLAEQLLVDAGDLLPSVEDQTDAEQD
jgi:hypothetical protein